MENKLTKIINELFDENLETLDRDCNLAVDMSIDSLKMMDLIVEIENKFEISIPDDVIGDLLVFGSLVDYVSQAIEGR